MKTLGVGIVGTGWVAGELFGGVIYAHQLKITIGQCSEELHLIAQATDPAEWANRLEFLPLG